MDVRLHWQIRDLEAQSEEEYEERQKVLREKKELERKMQALLEERPSRDKGMWRCCGGVVVVLWWCC